MANAMKVLQACICMSVNTGLFLLSLVATSIVKLIMLALVFSFNTKYSSFLSIIIMNLTILWATRQLKIALYSQTCKYWPVLEVSSVISGKGLTVMVPSVYSVYYCVL